MARHHNESLTAGMTARRDDWLDRLWIFDGILEDPALESERGRIKRFRRRELLRTVKRQLGRLARGNVDLRPFARYLRHRLRST